MVMMSKGLDLDVVGEGIETAEQLSFLKKLGCKAGQGYYYSRPLTAEDFSAYLQEQDAIAIPFTAETPNDKHVEICAARNFG